MCVININLDTTTPDGTTIVSASGQYRLQGATNWSTPFNIDLSNPNTPNITGIGIYELRVNVTNSVGITSEWALGSFEVSTVCGGGGGLQTCTSNCGSGWNQVVEVPQGEQRFLTIQKIGLATYAGSLFLDSLIPCDDFIGTLLSNASSNNILEFGPFTTTTTFKFGLDANQNQTGTAVSQLVIRTYSDGFGQGEVSADAYSRTHRLNNIGNDVVHC